MTVHLCFHGIGVCRREREPGEARYWIDESVFLAALDVAAERPGEVELSFDDGNRSDLEIGLPALRERGLQATFFALAGRLDDPESLSPADLRALRDAGMAIGSHGWAHVPWRGLTDDDVQRELVDARRVLADASGGDVDRAALPLGRYDRRLLAALRRERYAAVYTSDRMPARRGAWLQARFSLTADDTADSVRGLVERRAWRSDARSLAASLVKRVR